MDSNSERKNYNPTAAAIREEIERLGPISFARFMELALYHPDHGYYNRDAPIIGKSGDFFTSVSVGSLFGEMLAFWLARELEKIPGTLQIVEAGAHDGTLAGDILSWLRNYRPDFAARVQYWIIEPSSRLENLQRQTLKDHPGVQWDKSIKELGTIAGAIISNELLDAFPVQVLEWRDGWRELGVCMNGNQFDWLPLDQLSECSKDALSELKELEPHLPQGFRVEFSPAAEKWWRTAAANLEEGLLLAVDYGDESAGLWAKGGSTLRSLRGHGVVANVLANPGEQDITASVNFSRICASGEEQGLTTDLLLWQSAFLARFAGDFFSAPPDGKLTRQFQTLTHPEHLGRAFKVLVQRRAWARKS